MSTSRIVIGAGIAGLLAADRAVDRGESVRVVSEDLGGLINEISLGDFPIDSGAEAFSTVGPEVEQLLEELGLQERLVYPEPNLASIISAHGRYRIPKGFLGVPASLFDPELEDIFTPDQIAQAKWLDSQPFGSYDTVAELIEARLGTPFLNLLVNPVLSGVHGSTAERLSAASVFGSLFEKAASLSSLTQAVSESKQQDVRPGASVGSLASGMTALVKALKSRLKSKGAEFVRAGVISAERTSSCWRLTLPTGTIESDALSICAGQDFLASKLKGFENLSKLSSQIKAVDVGLVIGLLESESLNSHPLGPGALITQDSGFQAKATTHSNAKWFWVKEQLPTNQHLVRMSFGRNGVLPETDLEELFIRELPLIYQIADFHPVQLKTVIWKNALVQSNASLIAEINREISIGDNELEVAGGFLTGNGILGIVRDHLKRRAT